MFCLFYIWGLLRKTSSTLHIYLICHPIHDVSELGFMFTCIMVFVSLSLSFSLSSSFFFSYSQTAITGSTFFEVLGSKKRFIFFFLRKEILFDFCPLMTFFNVSQCFRHYSECVRLTPFFF